MSLRLVPVLLAGLLVPACQHGRKPRDCAGMTREQCLFERGKTGETDGRKDPTASDTGDVEVEFESAGWTRMEQMLQDAAQWLADGLGGEVVSEQAKQWCADEPSVLDKGHGPSWACHVEDPPRVAGRDVTLESGSSGILAMAARDLDGEQSQKLVRQAKARWRDWCVGSGFSAIERFAEEEFQSCALPGGPLLVIGRFPQDLEADLWQVSLTVMGAS